MALPTYKDIVELIKKGATVEAQERIMELREAALELQEENFALREKVRELEDQLRVKGQVSFDGRVYWLGKDGGGRDGPFCQRCYDAETKLIRVQSTIRGWYCNSCKVGVVKS
jgi:hypothetical protein